MKKKLNSVTVLCTTLWYTAYSLLVCIICWTPLTILSNYRGCYLCFGYSTQEDCNAIISNIMLVTQLGRVIYINMASHLSWDIKSKSNLNCFSVAFLLIWSNSNKSVLKRKFSCGNLKNCLQQTMFWQQNYTHLISTPI